MYVNHYQITNYISMTACM